LRLSNDGDGVTLSVGITSGNVIPCNEIVDGVSWESGGANDVTATSSGTCADTSPHPGVGNGDFSLQRIQNGNDTHSSAADFGVAVRTPAGPRPCLLDPECSILSYFPCVPLVNFTVEVSFFAVESSANLSSVRIFYRPSTAAQFDSIDATGVAAQLFRADLPGQANQARMQYYAVARDAAGNVATIPTGGATAPREYRVGPTAITAVQGNVVADSCGSSAYAGTAVNVRGVVTHRAGEFEPDVFFVQRGNGPNAGIRVRSPGAAFVPDLGDSVTVNGMVEEQNCQTTIVLFPECGEVHASRRKVRARVVTSPADVALEVNEGVLVTLRGPCTVATPMLGQDDAMEFGVTWSQELAWVGGDTFQPDGIGYMIPAVGTNLDSITGVVMSRSPTTVDPLTRLRLEPRRDYDVDLDVTDAPAADEFAVVRLHPNPARLGSPPVTIEFVVRHGAGYRLAVHDARGALVRRLAAGSGAASDRERVLWDGTDAAGRAVAAGAYFVRLHREGAVYTRKLLLLR
jgi:hypothetical protein